MYVSAALERTYQSEYFQLMLHLIAKLHTYVKPKLGSEVHTPQFHNIVNANHNGILCTIFVVILEKMPVPNKSLFNAQLD